MGDLRRYEMLDAMRGVAALAVVVHHARAYFSPLPVAVSGYLAVDIFFLLSGFVVAHAYDAQLAAGRGFAWFAQKRVIRLWPLMAMGLSLGLVTAIAYGKAPPEAAGAAYLWGLLGLPAFGSSDDPYALNVALWSLTFELVANFLFAAFHGRLTTPVLLCVTATAAVALVAMTVHNGGVNMGWSWDHWAGGFARVGVAFPAGILLYRHRNLIPHLLPSMRAAPLLMALVAAFFVAPGRLVVVYDLVVVFMAAPLLVAMGASYSGRVPRPLIWLGAVSYALYATHFPLLVAAPSLKHHAGLPAPVVGLTFIAAALMLAWLADRVDVAVRRRLGGLSSGLLIGSRAR